jgi:drug/metabolite transporter (DMT)-like permease
MEAMSPRGSERAVVLTMRGLAITFAVVGILFISTPDGVIGTLDDVGDWFGGFSSGPATDEKFWLALAFAYMTIITGLAVVISLDPRRYRPMLLVLAAGKTASSLAAGAFFVFDREVFIYLANFVVDASLAGIALTCFALLGAKREIEARAPV